MSRFPHRWLKSIRRSVDASFGAILLFGGAAACVFGIVLPHSAEANVTGYAYMAVGLTVAGIVMLLAPPRLQPYTPAVTIILGMVACGFAVALNGEANGGPPTLNEAFYIWPVLYLGYFVPVRWTVAALGLAAATYVAALSTIDMPTSAAVSRAIMLMSVLAGTATVLRRLRNHVDKLVARLDALARTDSLTKVANRRAFDEQLTSELTRTERTKEPFVLLLADIDNFKAINDARGHAAGDAALVAVAEILTKQSRGLDTVARVGGEEFAILLPQTGLTTGVEVAERLRAAVASAQVTVSFGVVEGSRHGASADDLLRSADRALYAAKASGRDRTVTPEGATVLAA